MTRKKTFFLALVPMLLGVGAFLWQTSNAPETARSAPQEKARPLRVLTLREQTVVPRTYGFGVAQPGRTWRAIARVEGRVTAVNEKLGAGVKLSEGDLVLELDRRPTELAIAKLDADIARLDAELDEVELREENDKASLKIEEQSLELAESELARVSSLRESGNISQSEFDSVLQSTLTQRQSAHSLRSSLSLYPSQRLAKQASIDAQKASLEEAQLDLTYTRIVLPFDAMMGLVDIEVGQFVAKGQDLFEAYGVARVDVDAEFLYGDARSVIGPEAAARLAAAALKADPSSDELHALFEATVRMKSGDLTAEWEARVTGARETVGESSRAIALRFAVDDPLAKAIPGVRPPLLQGSFCEVELRGLAQPGRLVVPRSAVVNDSVILVDKNNRMRSRPVVIDFEQGLAAIVSSGLAAGDRVLVSDPGPALEGALVAPDEDTELGARLTAEVTGAGE